MASRSSDDPLPLNDPSRTEAWLRGFAALSRTRKLKDLPTNKQVTDLFLSRAGVDAIHQVSLMAHPRKLEDMDFSDINAMIMERYGRENVW